MQTAVKAAKRRTWQFVLLYSEHHGRDTRKAETNPQYSWAFTISTIVKLYP